ncbi:MAG: hypothetical protein FWC34_02490 [Bacteroidetes bacterium]|nr:hypothetical protein [Bacteroidota bacterium]MCL2303547.1 hypothetical protein [Lentimicrobiaceae bacterium]
MNNIKHKLFLLISSTILFCCCHKITRDEEVVGRINDGEVYILGNSYATLKLFIYDKDIDKIGVCFSENNSSSPSLVDSVKHAFYNSSEDAYYVSIENLKEKTTYYWRTFIQKENTVVYGKVNRFTTTGTPGTWTQMADFFGARETAVGFSIGDKGYIGTGTLGHWSLSGFYKDFWEYDPSTNTWTQKADFGGGERAGAVGFSIGDRGYVGTGSFEFANSPPYPTGLNDFWEYNPVTNEWTQKANFGGGGRIGAVGFSIENKGYIGTGNSNTSYFNDFWEYDPEANSWLRKTNVPAGTTEGGPIGAGRHWAVGFSIGNKGYVGMGYGFHGYLANFWEYDPFSNNWTEKRSFAGGKRADAVGFSIGNKGYVGLGRWDLVYDAAYDFWEYSPDLDIWIEKERYPGRGGCFSVGFSIGDKGYVGTGCNGASNNNISQKDFWRFTP